MNQGEIWWAKLDPRKGKEQKGIRPVLIISGPTMNELSSLLIICPLTTQLKKFNSSVILEKDKKNGLSETSEILTHQVCAIDKLRIKGKIGDVEIEQLRDVIIKLNQVLFY